MTLYKIHSIVTVHKEQLCAAQEDGEDGMAHNVWNGVTGMVWYQTHGNVLGVFDSVPFILIHSSHYDEPVHRFKVPPATADVQASYMEYTVG